MRPPERLRMIHEAELGCREPQTGDRKWILSGGDRGPRGGHATIEDSRVGQRNQRGWAENKGDQRRLDGLNGEPRTFTRQASLGFSKNEGSSAHVFLAEGWTLSNVSNPQIDNLAPAGMLMLVTCQTWLRR